jgi:hypothetical protein
MSNWDFVVPYDSQATDWLEEQHLPHPAVRPGNRLPSTLEIAASWRKFDHDQSILIDNFQWDDDNYTPSSHFKLKGDWQVELNVLTDVCTKCGQLWMYPDTGAPAIVVDESLDVERTLALYERFYSAEDGWQRFYAEMYGKHSQPRSGGS